MRIPLEPLIPVDTRPLFRPVSGALVTLLRDLAPAQWMLPTVAGAWAVRDVAAHLLDTTLRRLSFHRDGMSPPRPAAPIASARDLVAFVNDLNAAWIDAATRLSPRVLVDLYARASHEAADWYESLPLGAPALFPVSWAGESTSAGWFDLGREFTELWHHQQQIRLAVGAHALADPRYLGAVLDIAVRGLPHALRGVPADTGQTVAVDISGPSGGQWVLVSGASGWTLFRGAPLSATARVTLTDDTAWKLFFNALSPDDAERAVRREGHPALGRAVLHARSVIV